MAEATHLPGAPGLPALQAVVAKLRDEHRTCPGRDDDACPWWGIWSEDVEDLHQALLEAGFAIARVRPS